VPTVCPIPPLSPAESLEDIPGHQRVSMQLRFVGPQFVTLCDYDTSVNEDATNLLAANTFTVPGLWFVNDVQTGSAVVDYTVYSPPSSTGLFNSTMLEYINGGYFRDGLVAAGVDVDNILITKNPSIVSPDQEQAPRENETFQTGEGIAIGVGAVLVVGLIAFIVYERWGNAAHAVNK